MSLIKEENSKLSTASKEQTRKLHLEFPLQTDSTAVCLRTQGFHGGLRKNLSVRDNSGRNRVLSHSCPWGNPPQGSTDSRQYLQDAKMAQPMAAALETSKHHEPEWMVTGMILYWRMIKTGAESGFYLGQKWGIYLGIFLGKGFYCHAFRTSKTSQGDFSPYIPIMGWIVFPLKDMLKS